MSSGRVKVTLSSAIAELGSNAQGVVALGEKVCVADRAIGGTGCPSRYHLDQAVLHSIFNIRPGGLIQFHCVHLVLGKTYCLLVLKNATNPTLVAELRLTATDIPFGDVAKVR